MAYHPPIFQPIKRVNEQTRAGRVTLAAVRAGIAVYSPHTALDNAPGGLNDWLAAGLGAGTVTALVPARDLPRGEAFKIVTFAPETAIGAIRTALGRAGAGGIGAYEQCSFSHPGTGTFEARRGAKPAVGAAHAFNAVAEVRLEMICSAASLPGACAALRASHPYEEPAWEIHALTPRPSIDRGAGRLLVLDRPASLAALASRLRSHLRVRDLSIHTPKRRAASVKRIGLCAGAGGSLLGHVLAARCDLFVTGEMRHHDVLDAMDAQCAVMTAGHTETERPYLPELSKRLRRALPGVRVLIARE